MSRADKREATPQIRPGPERSKKSLIIYTYVEAGK